MFTPVTLAPKRLQARYGISREDLARIRGSEPTLRADLGGTMGDVLDAQTLAGNGTDPNLPGFLATNAKGGLADVDDPAAAVTFDSAAAAIAAGVDGKYAGSEKECAAVIGVATYAKLASLFQAGSGVAATSYAMKMLRKLMASANVPAKTNANIQQAILDPHGPGRPAERRLPCLGGSDHRPRRGDPRRRRLDHDHGRSSLLVQGATRGRIPAPEVQARVETDRMGASRRVSVEAAAADTWSEPLPARPGEFQAHVAGDAEGAIDVQQSLDNGATWRTFASHLGPGAYVWANPVRGAWYRIGLRTHTSGTARLELAQ